MNTPWITVGTLVIVLAGNAALGQPSPGEALAQKYGCFECHSIEKNAKGPAFRNVAARYSDDIGRYDLSFVTVDSPSQLPLRRDVRSLGEENKSWIVLARIGDTIHLRIFDQNNTLVFDKAEKDLNEGLALTSLKARLKAPDTSDASALPNQAKRQIIENVLSAAGYTHRNVLIKTIAQGGKGNWTEVSHGTPMPPHSKGISTEEIARMVDWVLSL